MAGLVRSEAEYRALLADLKGLGTAPLAIDTETTGLRLYRDDVIRGVSFAYRKDDELMSWYLPISHGGGRNFKPSRLITAFNRHRGLQVFHNGPFDWTALTQADKRYKLPEGRYYDTQVMSWLMDENADHRLKQLGMVYFGGDAGAEQRHLKELRRGRKKSLFYTELRAEGMSVADAKVESARLHEESKRDWATFTGADIAEYAAKDTEITLRLMEEAFDHRGRRPEYAPTPEAFDRELRLQFVLWRMMRTGIRIDQDVAARQSQEAQARHDELAALFDGVNLNSTPQLRTLLFETWGLRAHRTTPTGMPSTDRAALEELEGDPRVRDLMEYRRLGKALSSYYRPFVETVGPDGRIHPSFSSCRTVTGRFSCSDPNLQTIPRGDTLVGVRDVFVPDEGFELWEYDLEAAELRVQASLSRDVSLMEALEARVDLHARTATMVWGPDFTGLQRRLAKNLNYGFSYGIGPRKFSVYMVAGTGQAVTNCEYWDWKYGVPGRPRRCRQCHVCQSADILDGYRHASPELVRLMKGLEHIARADGYLELAHAGRYRHFRSPGMQVPYFTALNAMVQGGVAETMKDVMLEAEPEFERLGARLCLQVHDSLVVEVLPGTGEKVQEMLQAVLDDMNVFEMRLLFTAAPWAAHG